MRRLAIFGLANVALTGLYTVSGYTPCSTAAQQTCKGVTFDNILLGVMSLAAGAALLRSVWKSRRYSTRGLGILSLLLILVGTYGRGVALPRLFGFPPLTLTELRLLRAILTIGTPLFVIGTYIMFREDWRDDRIREESGL